MAKDDFWTNDTPASPASDGGDFWSSDRPAAQVDLPEGVEPSQAGAGRGVMPASAYDRPAPVSNFQPDNMVEQYGEGADGFGSQKAAPVSVLQTQGMGQQSPESRLSLGGGPLSQQGVDQARSVAAGRTTSATPAINRAATSIRDGIDSSAQRLNTEEARKSTNAMQAEEWRTVGEWANDSASALASGAVSLAQLPVNIIAPGSALHSSLEKSQQALADAESEPMKARRAQLADRIKNEEGFLDQYAATVSELVTNPSVAVHETLKQAAMFASVLGMAKVGGAAGAGAVNLAGRASPTVALSEAISGGSMAAAAGAGGATAGGIAATTTMAAGDAAGNAYSTLMKSPQAMWDRSEDYRELIAKGASPEQAKNEIATAKARTAALIAAPLGLLGFMGAEASFVNKAATRGTPLRTLATELVSEPSEEALTQVAGNYAVKTVNPDQSLTEGAGEAAGMATVASGPFAGAAAINEARRNAPKPIDRSKQIQALRKSGDEVAASHLERKSTQEKAAYSADREAGALGAFGPDLQNQYRTIRASGAPTGVATTQTAARWTLAQASQVAGLSPKAQDAIASKLAEVPPEKAAEFVQKAVTGLVNNGMAKPFDGMDTLAMSIEQQRDAMLDSVLSVMDDIETLEADQDAAQQETPAAQAGQATDPGAAAPAPAGDPVVSGEGQPGGVGALSDQAASLDSLAQAWDWTNKGSRADEWFDGANVNEQARAGFADALANGGSNLRTHGMAKEGTLSGGVKSLLSMLQNGLDSNRNDGRLHYAPLVADPNAAKASTTASGSAYSDGPFMLVARPGQEFSGKLEGVGAVLVNQSHADIVPALRARIQAIRPDIIVEAYAQAGDVTKALNGENKQSELEAALNSEWQQFPEQTGTLNVPRAEMPQVKNIHRGPLVNFLGARGVTTEQVEVDPAELKPTQSEFSQSKVAEATDRNSDRAILISSDNHIIDGHHQAIAKLENGEPVRALRLNAPAADLIPLVKEFPSATVEQTANVQNPQAPAAGTQAQAAPVEAPAAGRGDAAASSGAPAKAGAGDVQADGMKKDVPETNFGNTPELLGQNSQPISEGAKPFKTDAAAKKAKKLHPGMRVKKVEGGYVLRPATEKEQAAAGAAAKRLGGVGKPGVTLAAHELIASRGGLSQDAMADLGFDRNVRVGSLWLFAGKGKGMSIAQASEALSQYGYMGEDEINEALSIISRSAKGQPQYTPEGFEAIAAAEEAERFEDYLAAEQQAAQEYEETDPQTLADLEAAEYYELNAAEQVEFRAIVAAAEAADIDSVAITEEESRLIAEEERHDEDQAQPENQDASRAQPDRAAGIEQGREAAEREGAGGREQVPGAESQAVVTLEDRPDGTMSVTGEAEAIKATLTAAGIPAKSIVKSARGVVVGKTQAKRARNVIEGRDADKAAPRTLDENGRATDGKPINAGDVFTTLSGRETTPYPKQQGQKFASQWLIDNAIAEARGRGDNFNATGFSGEKPLKDGTLASASRESMLMYLFGEQPVVAPSILKPLVQEAPTLTAPTQADIEAQQDRTEQADKLDQREQVKRESEVGDPTFMTGFSEDGRQDTTGGLFDAPTEAEIAPVERGIEADRKALIDLENKIVGAADMAPGFIEDAMKSRKVPKALKDERNALREKMRSERERVADARGNGPMFSRSAKPASERDMIVTHNLTAENVMHAIKMGGIPVPSLAVTRKDNPLTNFGEITLIGKKEMADPKGYAKPQVFWADIYSPRYPSVEYKIEGAALKSINEKLRPFLDGGLEIYGGELSRLDDLTSNKAFKRFASDKLGEADPNAVGYHELKGVASALIAESGAEERIFRGYTNSGNRKYIPHTLDNVVAILKKELRGGENFSYGVGSVRAKYTPKFNSIKDIRKGRDRLVTKEEFDAIKKEVDDEFFKIGDELSSFHGASKSFGYSDAVALMMSDAAKMGIPRALEENGFEDVSPESMETVRDYLNKLRTLPTEYFEAKILRPVALAEFAGAVVPAKTDAKVIEAMQKQGITRIVTYRNDAERKEVIRLMAENMGDDAMFSRPMSADLFRQMNNQALRGMSKTDVQQAIAGVTGKWANGPKVNVVATTKDLPMPAPADVHGVYFNGSVYLVAANIGDKAAALKVLAHEAIAHHGLRNMLGKDDWKKFMGNIQLALKTGNKPLNAIKADVRKAYVDDAGTFNLTPGQESDEIAAKVVEQAIDADGNFRPGFGFVKSVYAKIAEFLRSLGITVKFTHAELQGLLVNAQRNLETGKRTQGARDSAVPVFSATGDQQSARALEALSQMDDLFALPKSNKTDLQGIADDNLEGISIRETKFPGNETMYTLTMPDETVARLTVRKSTATSVYGAKELEDGGGYEWITGRRGENVDAIEDGTEDLWIDVSLLKEKQHGAAIYNIAATFAHNTGRIFIGDPNGLSKVALRRRTEQMLSSALKFGTTDHLAPHQYQIDGDAAEGVPGLRWVHGDSIGNIERMIDVTLKSLENALPNLGNIRYDLASGNFVGQTTGRPIPLRVLAERARDSRRGAQSELTKGRAGWRTVARAALLRDLRAASRAGRVGDDGGPILALLRGQAQRLRDSETGSGPRPANQRIFYSRSATLKASAPVLAPIAASAQPQLPNVTQPQAAPVPLPEETKARAAQRKGQDQFNRFTVIRNWAKEQGMNLSQLSNVWGFEERMHGRIASRLEDFREDRVKPLVQKIQKAGFTMTDVAEFLHAQHAGERNKQILTIDPSNPSGSGMTDADANAILAKASPALKALANEFRDITTDTRQILLDAGIISSDMAKAWDDTYKHYVPLKGGDEDTQPTGTGKGLSVKATNKRAMGHGERSEFIVENIMRDHERAVMLAEKNLVGHSLLAMAIELGRDDIATVGKPERRKVIKNATNFEVVAKNGTVLGVFDSQQGANSFIVTQTRPGLTVRKVKGDPMVSYAASPMLAENEVQVYARGHTVRIQLNDPLLARQYKKLGVEQLTAMMRINREVNSFLSRAYTAYNPEFFVRNVLRDFTSGLINMTGQEGALFAAKSAARYPKTFAQMLRYSYTGKASPSIKLYREHGGSTGAAYLGDIERIGADIQGAYEEYQGAMQLAASGKPLTSAKVAGKKLVKMLVAFMEHLNAAGENAMRLAVFDALRNEPGRNVQEAASLAKNSTVNFNRKGEIGAQANALYMFFNPAMQGTAATLDAMFNSKHKHQAQVVAGSLALLAYSMAAMQFGGDDEEDKTAWEKVPDYVKDRNLVIRTGDDTYITLSIPYGYGFFFTLGNALFDLQRGGDVGKIALKLTSGLVEHFGPAINPLGGDELDSKGLIELVPGAFGGEMMRNTARLVANRSSLGSQIVPDATFDEGKPDSQRMFRTSKGTPYEKSAALLNQISGGTKSQPGMVDISPETVKFWVETVTGGTGKFVVDTATVGTLMAARLGEDDPAIADALMPEIRELPIVRTVVRKQDIRDARQAYWETARKALDANADFKRARSMEDADGLDRVASQDSVLLGMAKSVEASNKTIKQMRDYIDMVNASDEYGRGEKRMLIKQVEQQERAVYDSMIQMFADEKRKANAVPR